MERFFRPNREAHVQAKLDVTWRAMYDASVTEVKKGRRPAYGVNARYMVALIRDANARGDLGESGRLSGILEHLRAEERQLTGIDYRDRVRGFDAMAAFLDFV